MPHPIPDWDLPRRVVRYIGSKQVEQEKPSVVGVCRSLGIGRKRLEQILTQKNIFYKIISPSDRMQDDYILITGVPRTLAEDAELSWQDIDVAYERILAGKPKRKIRKKLSRQEKQIKKVNDFWLQVEREQA